MTAPRGRAGGPGTSTGVPPAARGAVIVGLAVIVGIIGLQVLDDSSTSDGAAPATGVTTPTTGASETTLPAARPQGEVRVKVYNASGVDGQAQATTDKLKSLGWVTLTPGDFGSTRTGTVVQCRSGFESDATVLAVYGVGRGSTPATVEPYPAEPARERQRRRLPRHRGQGRVARAARATPVPLPPDLAALAPFVDAPRTAAFLVDYDGSLAPIVDDPAAARPLPAALQALARLVPLVGRAAVVSGRPAGFLVQHLPVDGLECVGLYGLERVVAGELHDRTWRGDLGPGDRRRRRRGGARASRPARRAQGPARGHDPLANRARAGGRGPGGRREPERASRDRRAAAGTDGGRAAPARARRQGHGHRSDRRRHAERGVRGRRRRRPAGIRRAHPAPRRGRARRAAFASGCGRPRHRRRSSTPT